MAGKVGGDDEDSRDMGVVRFGGLCCSVLQYGAVRIGVLWCVAVLCEVL